MLQLIRQFLPKNAATPASSITKWTAKPTRESREDRLGAHVPRPDDQAPPVVFSLCQFVRARS
jgi:hypothetical protein